MPTPEEIQIQAEEFKKRLMQLRLNPMPEDLNRARKEWTDQQAALKDVIERALIEKRRNKQSQLARQEEMRLSAIRDANAETIDALMCQARTYCALTPIIGTQIHSLLHSASGNPCHNLARFHRLTRLVDTTRHFCSNTSNLPAACARACEMLRQKKALQDAVPTLDQPNAPHRTRASSRPYLHTARETAQTAKDLFFKSVTAGISNIGDVLNRAEHASVNVSYFMQAAAKQCKKDNTLNAVSQAIIAIETQPLAPLLLLPLPETQDPDDKADSPQPQTQSGDFTSEVPADKLPPQADKKNHTEKTPASTKALSEDVLAAAAYLLTCGMSAGLICQALFDGLLSEDDLLNALSEWADHTLRPRYESLKSQLRLSDAVCVFLEKTDFEATPWLASLCCVQTDSNPVVLFTDMSAELASAQSVTCITSQKSDALARRLSLPGLKTDQLILTELRETLAKTIDESALLTNIRRKKEKKLTLDYRSGIENSDTTLAVKAVIDALDIMHRCALRPDVDAETCQSVYEDLMKGADAILMALAGRLARQTASGQWIAPRKNPTALIRAVIDYANHREAYLRWLRHPGLAKTLFDVPDFSIEAQVYADYQTHDAFSGRDTLLILLSTFATARRENSAEDPWIICLGQSAKNT